MKPTKSELLLKAAVREQMRMVCIRVQDLTSLKSLFSSVQSWNNFSLNKNHLLFSETNIDNKYAHFEEEKTDPGGKSQR